MQRINRIMTAIIAVLIILLTILASYFFGVGSGARSARAAAETYSDVLEDLQKDPSFNSEAWTKDSTLKVVQIAESSAGELFVYIAFDESGFASEILDTVSMNMSVRTINEASEFDDLKFINYKLELLNSNKHFHKFKVKDYTVLNATIRCYSISAILRKWDKNKDSGTGNDNTINDVVFRVAQMWRATTGANGVTYEMAAIDVITITDKYVDFLRYPDGYYLFAGGVEMCDSHYVAFSTDRKINELYEADIEYKSRYIWQKLVKVPLTNHQYKVIEDKSDPEPTTVMDTIIPSEVSNSGKGPWGVKHNWNRIEKVSEFIDKENLTDTAKNNVKNKQWVLRFTETYYQNNVGDVKYDIRTEISEVMILRLKFAADGVTYNLGVVDNRQTGDSVPGNNIEVPPIFDINHQGGCNSKIKWWAWLLIGIAVIAVILLIPVWLPLFIKLICLPFKAIGKASENISEDRKKEKTKQQTKNKRGKKK